LVSIAILSILASLSFGGILASRRRAREVKTETTIRKIHEVIMPHFERFLHRGRIPQVDNSALESSVPAIVKPKFASLISKRRIQALEMPDSWLDLDASPDALDPDDTRHTAISNKMRSMMPSNNVGNLLMDAECLWAMVMRGGFADPGIISHFRADEFGDQNDNDAREFLDGWGNPIRFLRWAPAFVSRYQPPPSSTDADIRSHDVFDSAALDPLAMNTLFPLVFSPGPDGILDIVFRNPSESYKAARYDPYFKVRDSHGYVIVNAKAEPVTKYEDGYGSSTWLNYVTLNPATASERAYNYLLNLDPQNPNPNPGYGARISTSNDDITNHSMSR